MRKDGLHEAKGIGPNGRRKSFYGKSKEEAQAKARASYGIQEDRTLYGFYAGVYLPTVAHRSDNWLSQIGWAMDKYVLPTFRNRDMGEITRGELQAFFNKLGKTLQPSSLNRVRIVMSGVFNLAEADDQIPKNLVRHVRLPSIQRPTKTALSAEDLRTLIHAAPMRIKPFIILTGPCGLRAGEALGVTRHNVKDGVLNIEQQVLQPKGGCKVTPRLKSPQSRRSVPLPKPLETMLLDCEQVSHIWVCSDSAGGFLTPNNASRELAEAVELAEIPRVTPHELRHTFISLLENDLECPPAIVASLAGKRYQAVTAAYSHVTPKQLARWMGKLWERVDTARVIGEEKIG